MKKILVLLLITISWTEIMSQGTHDSKADSIKKLEFQITGLKIDRDTLKSQIAKLQKTIANVNIALANIETLSNNNSSAISNTSNQLGIQIKETGDKNEGKITEVSESLGKNSLYGIIGVLTAILLSGLLFWLLSKRQQTDKTDFIEQLSKTKSSIEESLVKEFGKQTELMDSQLHFIEQQKITLQATPNLEPDHSLALKVASEINLIERNINLMDSKTKGLKQLQASVGKLKDNLSANGYEMPELLGKQFHQGLKVIVTSSIPDENLEKGQEIISKILIPAVTYNDKMIQTAQIEVSVGY
jgi:hypothetical protein